MLLFDLQIIFKLNIVTLSTSKKEYLMFGGLFVTANFVMSL